MTNAQIRTLLRKYDVEHVIVYGQVSRAQVQRVIETARLVSEAITHHDDCVFPNPLAFNPWSDDVTYANA